MPELIPAAPRTDAWHHARRQGVTATDIVTILGLSTHDSPYSLFWRKLGQVPEPPDTARWALGRYLEPYVAQLWGDETGIWPGPAGLYRHRERAWQLCTPDALADEPDAYIPVELKTWADADRTSWHDGPPPAVRAQVLWQMDVMDAATGHVGVLFLPSGDFRTYEIGHENSCDEICTCDDVMLMREAGLDFYRRMNLELPPPDPDTSAATLAALKARFARDPLKRAEIDAETFRQWDAAKDMAQGVKEALRAAEIRMRDEAGEAGELTVNGEVIARRRVYDSPVKAHTRRVDGYWRVTPRSDDE